MWQASEQQVSEARELANQLEARIASQANLLQEQESLLLAYAMGQASFRPGNPERRTQGGTRERFGEAGEA